MERGLRGKGTAAVVYILYLHLGTRLLCHVQAEALLAGDALARKFIVG